MKRYKAFVLCAFLLATPARADMSSMMPDPGDAASFMVWMMRTMMNMFEILTGNEDFDMGANISMPGVGAGYNPYSSYLGGVPGMTPLGMSPMGLAPGMGWPGMTPGMPMNGFSQMPWQDMGKTLVDKGRDLVRTHPLQGDWIGQGGMRLNLTGERLEIFLGPRKLAEGRYMVRGPLLALLNPLNQTTQIFRYELKGPMLALGSGNGQVMYFQRQSAFQQQPYRATVPRR